MSEKLIGLIVICVLIQGCVKNSSKETNKVEEKIPMIDSISQEDTSVKPILAIDTIKEESEKEVIKLPKGTPSPYFSLPSTEGKTVSLDDLKGNVVLLEFWFPECRGCLLSIPMMNELYAEYKNQGLKVYGVEHRNVDLSIIENYKVKNNTHFPSLYNGKQVSKLFNVWLSPAFYVIDKQGNIIFENTYSEKNKEKLSNIIERALEAS